MAGIFKIAELEARKRALAEQNDLCRQMLQLELRNLQIYAVRVQGKVSRVMSLKPLLAVAGPLALWLWRGRRIVQAPRKKLTSFQGLARTAMLGWTLYRRFWPTARELFLRKRHRGVSV